jgi:GT2 family glycosyltransferase/glycosyltransferase involved in cell wall biosynthesis
MKQDVIASESPAWSRLDRDWYQKRYGDLPEWADGDDVKELYRRIAAGQMRSPNPYFNEAWYRETFKDVSSLIEAGQIETGFEHYQTIGYPNRSPHWLFSESFYRLTNRELTQSRLDDGGFWNGYDHFLRVGDREKRQGSLFFDPRLYLDNFVSKSEAYAISPFTQFAGNNFKNEFHKRLSWYFDAAWYVQAYPEIVAELDSGNYSSALEHYLRNKTPQKFDPSGFFSESHYLSTYPDIAQAVSAGRFRNGYDHFTQHGVFERRQPQNGIDLETYFRKVAVQADIEKGLFRDVYAHYVANAERLELPRPEPIREDQARRLYSLQSINFATGLARRKLDFTLQAEPKISVVMVMHNHIERSLKALQSVHNMMPKGEMELILVDANSDDDTKSIAKFVRGARHLRFEWNAGLAKALNAGIDLVQAPATLFLSSAAVIEGDSVQSALERLFSANDIGVVGGKIIQSHGMLREAGCIVWRDGSISSYQRNKNPNIPEANFVRDADFCSADFLMVRSALLKQIAGFDETYGPAQFAEADLCIRLAAIGYRTVYDPSVILTNYDDGEDAVVLGREMEQGFARFQEKNAAFLAKQPARWTDCEAAARHAQSDRRLRILFVEDRIPFRHLGSGYTRANDIIHAMVRLGYHVTVFPVFQAVESLLRIVREFPDCAEIIYDRELPDLPAFLNERAGYYDILWLGRTQNAARVLGFLKSEAALRPATRMILDTEAVAALRTHLKKQIFSPPVSMETLPSEILKELEYAGQFDMVVAVNKLEADVIKAVGFNDVNILGHVQPIKPGSRSFEQRQGLLFVGALHDKDSPNLDSLAWFVKNVLPKLADRLPEKTRLTVAGYVHKRIDLAGIGRVRGVDLPGPQEDLAALYDEHRVFIAPTRFAAGIPYKLHEAAAHGIPIVASALLARQVGWEPGVELLAADTADPDNFVTQICALYLNPELWQRTRDRALARIALENTEQVYDKQLRDIVDLTFGSPALAGS